MGRSVNPIKDFPIISSFRWEDVPDQQYLLLSHVYVPNA